jgi:ADP-ribosylglycohydrolase
MPVHWYYDRRALHRDYGRVKDYLAPRNPHPDSILWRSRYEPVNEKGNILHDQAVYWGRRDVHYHQFLRAGENTLNVKLCALLMASLKERGAYDADDYLRRYIAFMTTPGSHGDTYVEEYHRHFFTAYAKGKPPRECGVKEKHIGGLLGMVPISVFYRDDPARAREASLEHLSLTHLGPSMETVARLIVDVMLDTLKGKPLREALTGSPGSPKNPFSDYPFEKWTAEPDEKVVGRRFSTACYVADSVPSLLYLAFKYHRDPEKGLVANTNLGGDNVHRGAILGALLGAANGMEGFPTRWIEGLRNPPPVLGPNAAWGWAPGSDEGAPVARTG